MYACFERNNEIINRYLKGEPANFLALEYGLSRNRVCQIIATYKKSYFKKIHKMSLSELKKVPIRVLNQHQRIIKQLEFDGFFYIYDILQENFLAYLTSQNNAKISNAECEGMIGVIEYINQKNL